MATDTRADRLFTRLRASCLDNTPRHRDPQARPSRRPHPRRLRAPAARRDRDQRLVRARRRAAPQGLHHRHLQPGEPAEWLTMMSDALLAQSAVDGSPPEPTPRSSRAGPTASEVRSFFMLARATDRKGFAPGLQAVGSKSARPRGQREDLRRVESRGPRRIQSRRPAHRLASPVEAGRCVNSGDTPPLRSDLARVLTTVGFETGWER
jgi:hypothetical protein